MKEWLPILFFSPVREQHQNPFVYERFFVLTFFSFSQQFSAVYCMHARVCVCVRTCWCVQILMSWCVHVSFILRQYMCDMFQVVPVMAACNVVVAVGCCCCSSLSHLFISHVYSWLLLCCLDERMNVWTNEWVSEWVVYIEMKLHWNTHTYLHWNGHCFVQLLHSIIFINWVNRKKRVSSISFRSKYMLSHGPMLLLLLILLHKCINFDCVRLTDNRLRCVFIICECIHTFDNSSSNFLRWSFSSNLSFLLFFSFQSCWFLLWDH